MASEYLGSKLELYLNSRDIFDSDLKVYYEEVGGSVGEYNHCLPMRGIRESIKINV